MDRLEIIETLKHFPGKLEAELAGAPDAALRRRPTDGEWSAKEVAGHLRDSAEVWYRRLYSVWSLTDPRFVSFDGEAWVKERGYNDAELAPMLASLREWRLKTVDLLDHAVDWSRLGSQPGVGRRTLKQFAEFVISHDEEHLSQIRVLLAESAHVAAPNI